MNRFLVWVALLWISGGVTLAQVQPAISLMPHVDERVELMSILARLADYEEYQGEQHKAYVTAIEQHFTPFRNHPAVAYMRQVRGGRNIGYDAVMAYAVQLSGAPNWTPLLPFAQQLPDRRWTVNDANTLARLVRTFYYDAHVADFFQKQQARYRRAENRFATITRQVDVSWFGRFYGQPPTQTFTVVLGLGNGGGNFGPHMRQKNGRGTVYAIMGTWSVDSVGEAQYAVADYLPTVIHEFNHSFANRLIDDNLGQLLPAADTIYKRVAEPMRNQAYGNGQTMLYESLVRAAVVAYMEEHDAKRGAALQQLREEQFNAFVWLDELVDLLHRYEKERERYPTLARFMPEHNAFYARLAPRIDQVLRTYADKIPRVDVIEPFANQAQGVDPAIQEIRIRFNRPVNPKRIGIQLGEGGREEMPLAKVLGFTDDGQTLRASLQLKPNHPYSFRLRNGGFQTPDGYLSKPYTVSFKTGEAK